MLDVMVVGAGPSGAVLAYLLARRGVEVLLLEKDSLPRYKTCGGGLTWKAMQNLPFDASSVFEKAARGGILTYQGKQFLKAELSWTIAWTVMRSNFDHFLVQKAVDAGAKLMDGVTVKSVKQEADCISIQSSDGIFQARLLVGADGVNSVVSHSLGLLRERKTGVALEAELAVPESAMQEQDSFATFDFGMLPHGYCWIFPKREHLSVGVFHASPDKAPDLRQVLDRFITSHPVLNRAKKLHVQGHRIPLGDGQQTLHQGRALLVGDAANLAEPWLGEGIYYAIFSARLAAEAIYPALRVNAIDLSEYTRQVRRQLAPQFRRARQLARLVYALPEVSSSLLASSPWMQDILFSALRGNRTYKQMVSDLLLGAPYVLAKAIVNGIKQVIR